MILEHFKRKKYKAKKTVSIQPDCVVKCEKCHSLVFKDEMDNINKICIL